MPSRPRSCPCRMNSVGTARCCRVLSPLCAWKAAFLVLCRVDDPSFRSPPGADCRQPALCRWLPAVRPDAFPRLILRCARHCCPGFEPRRFHADRDDGDQLVLAAALDSTGNHPVPLSGMGAGGLLVPIVVSLIRRQSDRQSWLALDGLPAARFAFLTLVTLAALAALLARPPNPTTPALPDAPDCPQKAAPVRDPAPATAGRRDRQGQPPGQ